MRKLIYTIIILVTVFVLITINSYLNPPLKFNHKLVGNYNEKGIVAISFYNESVFPLIINGIDVVDDEGNYYEVEEVEYVASNHYIGDPIWFDKTIDIERNIC